MKTPEKMAEAIRLRFMRLKLQGISPDFYLLLLDEVARHYDTLITRGEDIDEIIAEISVILTERQPSPQVTPPHKKQVFH